MIERKLTIDLIERKNQRVRLAFASLRRTDSLAQKPRQQIPDLAQPIRPALDIEQELIDLVDALVAPEFVLWVVGQRQLDGRENQL